jgi:flagellar assembly protein FliH
MISLSRLIKPVWPNLEYSEEKVIAIKMVRTPNPEVKEQAEAGIEKTTTDLLNGAKGEAEQIIRQAKLEYESVMGDIMHQRNSWQEEKEMLINKAREEGYQSGWSEGQQQGYSEYRKLIEKAREITAAAKDDYTAYLGASEKVILDMAIKIAEKIVVRKIEDDEYFVTLVKRALKEAKESHDIQLHVHPESYDYILSQKEELLLTFSHETNLFIYPDEEMPVGGCVIESETGRIDAGIDTQLSEIKRILTELLESDTS